ncbi:MAG: hypothetical protein WCJ56_00365, partial [bacterium]
VPTATGLVIGTALPGLVNNELVSFADRGTLVADGQRLLRYNGSGTLAWAAFATRGRDPGLMGPVAPTANEDKGTAAESFNLLTRVRRLPNGNLLLCDTGGSRVVEMDRTGKIVWQYPDSDLTFQDLDKDATYQPIHSVNSGGALSYFDIRQPTLAYYRLSTPRDVRRYAYNSPVADPAKVQVFWRRPYSSMAFNLADKKWHSIQGGVPVTNSTFVVDSALALSGASPYVSIVDAITTSPMIVGNHSQLAALTTISGKVAYQTDNNKWYAFFPMPAPQPAQWQEQHPIVAVDSIIVLLALPGVAIGDTYYCSERRARYTLVAQPATKLENWRAQPVIPFLASDAEMTAQLNVQPGDRVYRTDAPAGWRIFIGGDPTLAASWLTPRTFTVASQAAMLALPTAVMGDIAIRTDVNRQYTLVGANQTVLNNWEVQQIIPSISSDAAMIKPILTRVGGRIYRSDEHRFYVLTALPATNIANWRAEKLLITLSTVPTFPIAVVPDTAPSVMLTRVNSIAGLPDATSHVGDLKYNFPEGKWYQLTALPSSGAGNWQPLNYYTQSSGGNIAAAVDGDRAYRTDEKKWYLHQGGAWVADTPLLAVGSRAAMLAYTPAQQGDVVYRQDTGEWYKLNALPASAAVNWMVIPAPAVTTPLLPTIAVASALSSLQPTGDIALTPYKAVLRWESTLIADTGNNRVLEVIRPLLKLEDTDKFNSDHNLNFARGFQYRPDCYYKYIDAVTTTWTGEKPLVQGVDEIVGGLADLQLNRVSVKAPLAYTVATRYRGIDNNLEDTYQPKGNEASYNDPAAQAHSRELLVALGNTVSLSESGNSAQSVRTLRLSRPKPAAVPPAPTVIRNYATITANAAIGDTMLQMDVAQEFKVGEQVDVTDKLRTVTFKTTITLLDTASNNITLAAPLPLALTAGDGMVWGHRINALESRPNTSDFAHIQQLELVTLRNGMNEEVHALVVDAQGVREIVMDPSRIAVEAPIFELDQTSYAAALLQYAAQVDTIVTLNPNHVPPLTQKPNAKAWAADNVFAPMAVVRQDNRNGVLDTDHHARYLISQMSSTVSADPLTWINGQPARRVGLFEARYSNVFGPGWGLVDDALDYFIFPDPLTTDYPSLPGGSYPLTQPLALAND